jgi:N-6 DNA Methylase
MRTKERVKQVGEVFTPDWLVEEMLDKLPRETWQEGKTFLDNSCGNGNFLIAVLTRKLQQGHDPLGALQSIYGTDIMQDNIEECRDRLLHIVASFGRVTEAHCRVVLINVKWLSLEEYPKGSLDYDFGFEDQPTKADVKKLLSCFRSTKVA